MSVTLTLSECVSGCMSYCQHMGPFMSIEVLLSMILLELCMFWDTSLKFRGANLLQLPVEE